MLTSPIGPTNTYRLGVVRDALIARKVRERGANPGNFWSLPVDDETWDGRLNDLNDSRFVLSTSTKRSPRRGGEVAEGAVGSGSGMICHGFKGGICTASRVLWAEEGGYTVGVLVQANHGVPRVPDRQRRAGGPRARTQRDPLPEPVVDAPAGSGSIIVVVASNVPLLPHQCTRLAQRAGLGVARTRGAGEHMSGDLFFCSPRATAA